MRIVLRNAILRILKNSYLLIPICIFIAIIIKNFNETGGESKEVEKQITSAASYRLEPIPTLPETALSIKEILKEEETEISVESAAEPETDDEPEITYAAECTDENVYEINTVAYSSDVYSLAMELYGIPEWNVTRALKLLTVENYGDFGAWTLSYYCGCTIINRLASDPYNEDIYAWWGGSDGWYGTWMDSGYIADWAYDSLYDAVLNLDTGAWYCNGVSYVDSPIYAEWCNGNYIYVY